MELKIIHFYPDLMSLYGSYANVWVLQRYLEALGHTVTVEPVVPGEEKDLVGADLYYMGAGTERSQTAALTDLYRYGELLKDAAAAGAAMLFAGTALELLGASITSADGTERPGIGLASFTSVQGQKRIVGDVYGTTDLFPDAVVGFMNKCTLLHGVETPLLTGCALGFGNETEGGPEGFHWNNVLGSELTGPILVKNPRLLEKTAAAICLRRGADWPQEPPRWPFEEEGYAITAEQLRLRCRK